MKPTSEATFAYSTDGIHWKIESFDEKYAFTSVAWSEALKRFVAVGHGGIIYTGKIEKKTTLEKEPFTSHRSPHE